MITPGIVAAQAAAIAAGGTEFTPPVSSGLQLYVDARYHDALSNGATMTAWTDLSGNVGRDITPASSGGYTAPTFARDTFGTGAHSWRFQSGKGALVPNFFSAFTAAEIFVVVKGDSDPLSSGTGALWDWSPAPSATNYPWSDGVIYDSFGRSSFNTVGNPSRSLAIINVYHVMAKTGGWTAWLNETQLFTTASGSVGWRTAGSPASLGNYGGGTYFNANIGAILMYNRELTPTERADTYAWLQAQWPGLP